MAKKSSPKSKTDTGTPAFVSSYRALAVAIGVSGTTIKKYKRMPGFPKKGARGYSVQAVQKWRDANLAGDDQAESGGGSGVPTSNGTNGQAPGWNVDAEALAKQLDEGKVSTVKLVEMLGDNPKRLADTLDKLESFRKRRMENEIQRGAFIPRDILDRAIVGLAHMFVGVLDEWVQALPQQVAGLDPSQIEPILYERMVSSRDRLCDQARIQLASAADVVDFKGGKNPEPPKPKAKRATTKKKRGRGRPPTRSKG